MSLKVYALPGTKSPFFVFMPEEKVYYPQGDRDEVDYRWIEPTFVVISMDRTVVVSFQAHQVTSPDVLER